MAGALLCGLTAVAHADLPAPLAEPAPIHGFVEPCTVQIVQDNTTECEFCAAGRACEQELGSRGYQRKCRTSGHSAPGEVWCISKRRKTELERAKYTPVIVAASASLLFGAFLLFKRRRRSAG